MKLAANTWQEAFAYNEALSEVRNALVDAGRLNDDLVMGVLDRLRKSTTVPLTREVETGREGRRAVAMKLVEIYNQPDDDLAEQAMTGFLMAVEFALQEAGISYHVDRRRIVVT